MYVRCIKRFRDLKAGAMREVGDEFDVTAERMEELNSTQFGILVERARKPRRRKTDKEQ